MVQLYEPFIRRHLSDPALGADADDLVQEVLAVTVNAVLLAKSWVLRRLRREAAGQIDGGDFP